MKIFTNKKQFGSFGDEGLILEDIEERIFISYTDLPEIIHQLNDILHQYLIKMKVPNESGLARQLRITRTEVQSWPSWKQKAMKDQL